MRFLVPILLSGFLAACASAPPTEHYKKVPPEDRARIEQEMCENVTCQHDVRVVLKNRDGSVFDETYASLPVVQPNGVSVYAGQTVLFEAEVDGNYLTRFKLVSSVQDPAKTISAELKQFDNGQMALTVTNPFGKTLKLSMALMTPDSEHLSKTSSCPIIAGTKSFELWPYPIFQVWLGGFRLLAEGDGMACEE